MSPARETNNKITKIRTALDGEEKRSRKGVESVCVRGVMRECHSRQELWKFSWKWHSGQHLKKMGGAGDDPEERQVLARGALEEQRGGLREVAPPD